MLLLPLGKYAVILVSTNDINDVILIKPKQIKNTNNTNNIPTIPKYQQYQLYNSFQLYRNGNQRTKESHLNLIVYRKQQSAVVKINVCLK